MPGNSCHHHQPSSKMQLQTAPPPRNAFGYLHLGSIKLKVSARAGRTPTRSPLLVRLVLGRAGCARRARLPVGSGMNADGCELGINQVGPLSDRHTDGPHYGWASTIAIASAWLLVLPLGSACGAQLPAASCARSNCSIIEISQRTGATHGHHQEKPPMPSSGDPLAAAPLPAIINWRRRSDN